MNAERELLKRLVEADETWRRSNEVSADSTFARAAHDIATRATALLAQPEPGDAYRAEIARSAQRIAHLEAELSAARAAIGVLAQPERKPQWSDQPPTEPGWYWFKSPQQSFDDPVWVGNGEFDTTNGYTYRVDQFSGQWAGPITPPEE